MHFGNVATTHGNCSSSVVDQWGKERRKCLQLLTRLWSDDDDVDEWMAREADRRTGQ